MNTSPGRGEPVHDERSRDDRARDELARDERARAEDARDEISHIERDAVEEYGGGAPGEGEGPRSGASAGRTYDPRQDIDREPPGSTGDRPADHDPDDFE